MLRVLCLLILATPLALADLGPKPTMGFKFFFPSGSKLKATGGTLYECEKADGSGAQPLSPYGPQNFECYSDSAYALAYGFQPYHILEIKFSDGKTRRSQVFATGAFSASFNVEVGTNDLKVVLDPSASQAQPPSRLR